MEFFVKFLKGILVGVGNIAPGVSGGALALIMGIYEDMVDAVGNFLKDIKKNFLFLLPIGMGAALGIVVFSGIIDYFLESNPTPTAYLFAGLITGTVPVLFRQANKKGFKVGYLVPMLITFACALYLVFAGTGFTVTELPTKMAITPENMLMLVVYGFILAGSIVIPGISGSVLLMLLGVYRIILTAIKTLDIIIIAPTAIGLGLGVLLFAKLMGFLLKRYHGITYYAVIGFVIGSIPEFLPAVAINKSGIFSIVLFIIGMLSSYLISRLEKN